MVSAGVTGIEKGVYTAAGSASKTSAKTSGVDFGMIMSRSLSNAGESQVKMPQSQDVSKVRADKDKSPQMEEKQIKENSAPESETQVKTTKQAEPQDCQVQETQSEPEMPEEKLSEKIQKLLEAVKEELKSKFHLTDEQVEQVLAQMGMQMQDLLQSNELTRFVAAATGQESVVDLLTQGELTEKLREVVDFVAQQTQEIAEEFNVSPQEVKDFAKEVFEPQETVQLSQPQTLQEETRQQPEETKHQNPEQVLEEKISVVQSPKTPQETAQQPDSGQKEKNTAHSGGEKSFTQTVAAEMSQHIEEAFAKVVDSEVESVSPAEIIRQVIESVRVTAGRELSGMEIQLNPEHLGKINLSVISRDGMVTAQIVTENESVKRAIEAQMATLRENFSQQGIKVEAVEVTVASHSFESNAQLQKGDSHDQTPGERRRRSLKLTDLEEFMAEGLSEEQQSANVLDENSSVEYTA